MARLSRTARKGDGDPLDVCVLSERPVARNEIIVRARVIGGLQLFEEPFILTGGRGGSDQAGMTTAIYLYRMAFDFNDFGAASAMSWLLFLVVAVPTWLTNRAFRPRPRRTPDPA